MISDYLKSSTQFGLSALFLTLAFSSAVSANTVTYGDAAGTQMVFEYKDDKLRMSTDADSYMLVLGDTIYSMSKLDGQWTVYDMSTMSALMKAVGNAESQHTQALIGADVQARDLRNTGRMEVISGIQGAVYNYYEPLTQREVEIVLTDDLTLAEITEKWVHFVGFLSGVQSDDSAKRFAGKDILRSDDFRVIRLSKGAADDDRFELPANPVSFGVDLPKTFEMVTFSDTLPAQSSSDEAAEITIETEAVTQALESLGDLGESASKAWNSLFNTN